MMDCARDYLFSASGLSRNEHRCICFRDALGDRDDALQRGAVHNRGHTQGLRVGLSGQESNQFSRETYDVRNNLLLKMWEI